ncbi:uncharacterized protein LOC141664809 [Apium graveolens]|uniref:uncharacterized protein LOC141664809 n=1 Tax=Apium graveolens TaxID=4045 RepID=UPI003D79A859
MGSRGDVVSASITRSQLWVNCKILTLYRNMRSNQATNDEELHSLKLFTEWVLNIGDGTPTPSSKFNSCLEEDDTEIPIDFCDPETQNSIENMIKWTYPRFLSQYRSPQYLSERAILTPTNQIVNHLNTVIVENILGDESTYYSVDRAEDLGGTASELSFAFPPKYLNSITIPGLPLYELKLKEG